MADWTVRDLTYWDDKIREIVAGTDLDCFEQEFEICDHNQMLGYMAYSGMPAHYSHWSYGKAFERQKTLYDHGVSGLPYELVINSNPSLAYLMKDNTLCLQILTIAHVYGHNDFFKNNFTFHHTRPELTLQRFKSAADRIRSYMEDPSIGVQAVEEILDAAHALAFQCRRNLALRKVPDDEAKARLVEAARPERGRFAALEQKAEPVEPDLQKVPLQPEEDLLVFIRDHNPFLADWQRDVLDIVHDHTLYFLPQIETKIMNEGWASYWHHWILHQLELPADLHMEFMVHHSQVLRPHNGQVNPYHLGFVMWHDIKRRWDEATPQTPGKISDPEKSGKQKMFAVREVDRDVSFLRRFLTKDLMRELDMFHYEQKGENLVVDRVADDDSWRDIKEQLIASVGLASSPVIRIEDADHDKSRVLFLRHAHEGQDLELEHAKHSLGYLHTLWGRKVLLETRLEDAPVLLGYGEDGFFQQALNAA